MDDPSSRSSDAQDTEQSEHSEQPEHSEQTEPTAQGDEQTAVQVNSHDRNVRREQHRYALFDISVARVRVTNEASGEEVWLFEATATDDTRNVSSNITDAVMGCIEAVSGGAV